MPVENTISSTLISGLNRIKNALQHRFAWLVLVALAVVFNLGFVSQALPETQSTICQFQFFGNVALALLFTYAVFLKSRQITNFTIKRQTWYFLIPLALLMRLLLAKLGGNYDLESFEIAGNIVLNGDSVYEHTNRYNYGPFWAYWLGFLKFLSSIGGGYNKTLFHSYIVCTLFVFELLLIKGLRKNGYDQLACLILLFNPLSCILIGHHSQFDIIAIATAYWAYIKIKENNILQGIILLGLSYAIKHIFVFFPLILLFDQQITLKNRLIIAVAPALIFAASFMPFISDWQAIKTNVLAYQLNHGQTLFYKIFDIVIPHAFSEFEAINTIPLMTGYKPIWILSFLILGYWIHRQSSKHQFELYLVYLVGSSLAISEQYLLIPIMMVVSMRRHFIAWLYLLLSTYYIMFVSAHNTAQYFKLSDLGMNLNADWYGIGFAQIQICLLILLYKAIEISNLKLSESQT